MQPTNTEISEFQYRNSVNTNIIGKLFTSLQAIFVCANEIVIHRTASTPLAISFDSISDIPEVRASIFGASLNLKIESQDHKLRFMRRRDSLEALSHIRDEVVVRITTKILALGRKFNEKALDQYLRDSSIGDLDKSIGDLASVYRLSKSTWIDTLGADTIAVLDFLIRHFPLEHSLENLRSNYEQTRMAVRQSFYDKIEVNPLTIAQREAVVRNNDRNLVLAAAGTGKTSVMVAKCLDLIDSGDCTADEILILAYNKTAASQLKERVNERSGSEDNLAEISTFHALGRKILRESKVTTYLSVFAEDPVRLQMWVTEWLTKYITSNSEALQTFIDLSYQPVNPFSFKTKGEYDQYVVDNEYRTLNGERVKGYQELVIANWLFLNCVEYEYEAPYITKKRIDVGFDYKPDFHIKGTFIYIEHFGIDRKGNTRPDINPLTYAETTRKKRDLHKEQETTLLVTFHYDWLEGNLEKRLAEQLKEAGICTRVRPEEEVLRVLDELGFITEGAKRYLKCLQAIRTERLDKNGIKQRLDEEKIINASKYADLLDVLHAAYVDELQRQNRIDFDDMIIQAIDCIKNQKVLPRWKHILVDEFQDISSARMELIQALIKFGPNPVLTVVGDDWQSIYRFSGGKLELTTRFGEIFGTHALTILDKTFRYNSNIAQVAGQFVMQNPEQYKKTVVTNKVVDSPQIYLLDSGSDPKKPLANRVAEVVRTIRKNDDKGSIAVLARYNYLLDDAKVSVRAFGAKNIKYWTFHGSKGLEADYCILIGFFRGKTGFPNENKEEAVLEALLPTLDSYPHSEERRLLYVALTRTRRKSYLIADPMAPSEFINELLSPRYKINISSEKFKETYRKIFKCPICTPGYFRLLSSVHGEFYSCNSGSVCKSKPRTCEKCGAPSIDFKEHSICNNDMCRERKLLCDICGRPMRLREGRYGKFLGCSGYGIKDDQCTHTRKYGF